MTDQVLNCQGELWVVVKEVFGDRNGAIRFKDTNLNDFGSFRVIGNTIGSTMYGALTVDTKGMTDGLRVRTTSNQGSPLIYPESYNDPYSLTVTGQTINGQQLNCSQPGTYNNVSNVITGNTPVLSISRANTRGSATAINRPIAKFNQDDVSKTNEKILVDIGNGTYNSYYTSMGLSTDYLDKTNPSTNYGIIGMKKNDFSETIVPCITYKYNGDVSIPVKLTAGIIDATTYVGLPAFNPAVLDPITLDSVNDRVGINNTFPSATLDVVGDVYIKGNVDVRTIIGDTIYQELKIDKTTHRVGIQTSSPTEVLDVEGNIKASGSVSGDTLGGTLSTAAQTNITSVGTLSSLGVTGTMTAGTVSATTYVGLPTPSVLPITLDTVNNRVGINQTSPSFTLDVTGAVRATGTIQCPGGFSTNATTIKSNTGNPEGTQTAPVGSLFLRTDGTSGTTLYTKKSGTGNTGWEALSSGVPGLGTIVSASKSTTTTLSGTTVNNLCNVSLSPGTYIIYGSAGTDEVIVWDGPLYDTFQLALSTSSTVLPTYDPTGTQTYQIGHGHINIVMILTITTTTTYYLLARFGDMVGQTTVLLANAGIKAVRIL